MKGDNVSRLINYLEPPGRWKQGIYQLKNYDEYAAIPALRSHELKLLSKSPAHYRASFDYPKEITPQLMKSFAKGRAFDALVLHGQSEFERIVKVEPDIKRSTNDYKAWRAKQPRESAILSAQEKEHVLNMYNSAMKKERFSEIFNGDGHAHYVVVWQDYSTGIWCKAEIDWIRANGTVVDLKSSADASYWFFQRQARRLGYANQGVFYLQGLTAVTGKMHTSFMLAVVESEPPFESHIFRVGNDQLLNAQVENENRIELLAQCLEKDEWPGYPDQIMDLESGQYEFEDYDDNETLEGGF